MLVQYISDIHIEFLHIEEVKSIVRKIIPVAPILVIAGDLGNPFSSSYPLFLNEIGNKFEKVFVIAGNHEYYGGKTMKEVEAKIIEITMGMNVTYLQNSYEEYKGVRWIGTTLWSRLDNPKKYINDMGINGMSVERYNGLHGSAVESLQKMLDESSIPCVVVTHHMPSYSLIDPMYVDDNYNMWFASHLDTIVEKYKDKIKLWIYGHTHKQNQYTLYNVPIVCNPIGYKGENSVGNRNYATVSF